MDTCAIIIFFSFFSSFCIYFSTPSFFPFYYYSFLFFSFLFFITFTLSFFLSLTHTHTFIHTHGIHFSFDLHDKTLVIIFALSTHSSYRCYFLRTKVRNTIIYIYNIFFMYIIYIYIYIYIIDLCISM